ncbi:asparaginase [Actinoplanes sp. NPDC049265]|uniref:asparaginase n=1 Tax=Actinoplanes sp. NPDC049265 TaxID=3363902 RepID=UPI00371C634B
MRVAVIGLGGTIAMTGPPEGGAMPALSAEQLVAAVPGLTGLELEIVAESRLQLPGASVTIPDVVATLGAIERHLDEGAAGVVVTQGTDTIEETSYLLDLLHRRPEPVVVTGAMRNPSLAGADGPGNLLAAIVTAASPEARELGCLVVMSDEIHAASRVRKTHSTSVSAFASPTGGPLGHVAERRAHLINKPPRRLTLPAPNRQPRVGIYHATLGDDGELLTAFAEQLDGLVIAAFGMGHVPATWVEPLTATAQRIPVVFASRTGAGMTGVNTYAFPGSEHDLITRGLIPAGHLDPLKSRLLLHLALSTDADRTELANLFTLMS